ncbi:MAG: hypothetical protein ACJ8KU_11015 [Chthoniobacterales bacterium]
MENQTETTPFFDLGDSTALVCIDQQQFQKLVVPQLIDMNYKVHLGLFEEDVLLKLKTYSYDVVLVHETFKGSKLETNPVLREVVSRSGTQRREHFVVLLSQRFPTNDAMSAFVQSVDQIINTSDLANLKPVLRRGVAQYRELYGPYHETVKAAQAM